MKHKSHVLKYEVAINLTNSLIVWIHGYFEGSTHDLSIARTYLVQALQPGESLLADKAYIGDPHFRTPFKDYGNLTPEQLKWNYQVSSLQSRTEKINGRFKNFSMFRNNYRGHDFDEHSDCFKIVGNCINISLCLKDKLNKHSL